MEDTKLKSTKKRKLEDVDGPSPAKKRKLVEDKKTLFKSRSS
jgi:hypothetical protein